MKFESLQDLALLRLGFDPKEYGRVFAFVDYGNVQHWYDEDRRKADGTRLQPDEVFFVDIKKLGAFLDKFVTHKRFYYGHIPNKPATLHIIALAEHCHFQKVTKPVHRTRHYLTLGDHAGHARVYRDEFGKDFILIPKCNFDVEITLDAVRRLQDYDSLMLLSSDRDFEKLLHYLKRRHKKVILVAGGYVSKDLSRHADKVVYAHRIKDLIADIKKKKARP